MNNKTVISCANCFNTTILNGKVRPKCCPHCKSKNRELTRARYWLNGEPDYSTNLIK